MTHLLIQEILNRMVGVGGDELEKLKQDEKDLRGLIKLACVNESLSELAAYATTRGYAEKTGATVKEFGNFQCYMQNECTAHWDHQVARFEAAYLS